MLALLPVLSLLLLAGWIAYCRSARYSLVKETEKRYGERYSLTPATETESKPRMIHAGLKGIRDAQRITRTPLWYDFPFISFTSLEFALFKTYGIPTISSLLAATGQLSESATADRRFIDTGLLIASMVIYPLAPFDLEDNDVQEPGDELISRDWKDPRSSIAIARINHLHGRWKGKISNGDLLYTMSLFVLEPPKFAEKYEWRPFTELEKEALFCVWYHCGRCMGITEIPESRAELEEWVEAYEQTHMVYEPVNAHVAEKTIDLLFYHVPKSLHSFLHPVVVTLLEDRLRKAFGFSPAPAIVKTLTEGLLRTRAIFVKNFMPPRKLPKAFAPADAQGKVITAASAAGSICPATGISAAKAQAEGKMCPVGNHMMDASTGQAKGYDDLASLTRTQPGWVENAPWYTTPALKSSWLYWAERIFMVPEATRRGGKKWQNRLLKDDKLPGGRSAVGYRLEECVSVEPGGSVTI